MNRSIHMNRSRDDVFIGGSYLRTITTSKSLIVNEIRLPKLKIPPVIRTKTAVYDRRLIVWN